MMALELNITTDDRCAEFDLFDTSSMTAGSTISHLGEVARAEYQGTLVRKAVDIPNVIEIAITIGEGAVGSLVANLVWEWMKRGLKQRPRAVEIDRVTVEFEEGAIKRLITEKLRATGEGE